MGFFPGVSSCCDTGVRAFVGLTSLDGHDARLSPVMLSERSSFPSFFTRQERLPSFGDNGARSLPGIVFFFSLTATPVGFVFFILFFDSLITFRLVLSLVAERALYREIIGLFFRPGVFLLSGFFFFLWFPLSSTTGKSVTLKCWRLSFFGGRN